MYILLSCHQLPASQAPQLVGLSTWSEFPWESEQEEETRVLRPRSWSLGVTWAG